MSDRHLGENSWDVRFERILRPLSRQRAPMALLLTATLLGHWYATHWRDIYWRATRTIGEGMTADATMGLILALAWLGGSAATLALQRLKE